MLDAGRSFPFCYRSFLRLLSSLMSCQITRGLERLVTHDVKVVDFTSLDSSQSRCRTTNTCHSAAWTKIDHHLVQVLITAPKALEPMFHSTFELFLIDLIVWGIEEEVKRFFWLCSCWTGKSCLWGLGVEQCCLRTPKSLLELRYSVRHVILRFFETRFCSMC